MNPGNKLILLVDDDSICNSINKLLISKKILKEGRNDTFILAYTEPVEGMKFLSNALDQKSYGKIIILLDINMPIMTGWEFLEEYAKLSQNETEVKVYILTSSVNYSDIERAKANEYVEDFISKPITSKNLDELFKLI
ncbi:MAG: response regulator [Bacteroidetes bacterium]|nr:response regulator [Bacteroidota bacterium]